MTVPNCDIPNSDADDNNEQPPANTDNTDTPLQFGLSDEALQAELHSYAQALRQEFELTQAKQADNETTNVERYTRDFFKKNLAHAAAQIVWLSSNSTSDSIRLKASQFIVKEALAASIGDGDPIAELLRELHNPHDLTQPA